MKFLKKMTDGGPLSNSVGYCLFEIKKLASVLLLRFEGQSREVFHEHAFHCLGWVLKGEIREVMYDGREYMHKPSIFPFLVSRRDFHQVHSVTPVSWVFTIRGPWKRTWRECSQDKSDQYTLSNGRVKVEVS